ncbi:polysaccharide pyruvyl transferase family protein [Sutcliffiella horikoshii]|uniref:polysaccharide pyruvyl transferase family protein n=1 Tax=Sutcliffiella horikoshii TaxID=79883 RepID=UPI003CF925DA
MENILFLTEKEVIRKKLYLKYCLSNVKSNPFNVDKSKKKIIVALAADYGNLGDVAITYAQTKFLKENFPEYEVIDFPISRTFTDMKALKKICTPNDIITIVGGGNTGDMYDDIEYCRQFIIKQFPENKIISFPQTVDFSETPYGKKAFEKAIKVYKENNELILIAREKKSYEIYKQKFSDKVLFVPDIVLSLDLTEPKLSREGITFCLRKDGEKKLSQDDEIQLINSVKKYGEVKFNDTHISKNNMNIEEREEELQKIWDTFKRSKLVITDRLHGMIFCAITGTPCIALDNSNMKISGVYNAWLKELSYINMLSEFDLKRLKKEISVLLESDIGEIKLLDLGDEFKDILKALT